MKIIIAPDKFKGSLTSFEVCDAIRQGLQLAGISGDIHNFPLADGGDGFSAVMQHYLGTETINCVTVDPLNRPMTGHYQWAKKSKTAIVELAVASGIALLNHNEPDAMSTSTYGTGLIIKHAIETGAQKIILGIGGSATNDGGTGILSALGFKFYNHEDVLLNHLTGGCLVNIKRVEIPAGLPLIEWTVCCDVLNPFYGPNGAAYVYAPQKGAGPDQVKILDNGLKNLANVFYSATGNNIANVPGAGAAGGVAGGLMAALNATFQQGIYTVLNASNIYATIDHADLIITGEGKLDEQSLQGKVVGSIAALAQQKNIPCVAFCGLLSLGEDKLKAAGLAAAYAIATGNTSLEDSIKNAYNLLKQKVAGMADNFLK